MTHSVTKAMPIQFIDGSSHIKKQRGRKTTLSSYYACLSCDLLLMPSGADTHIHQRSQTKRLQEARSAGPYVSGLKMLKHKIETTKRHHSSWKNGNKS